MFPISEYVTLVSKIDTLESVALHGIGEPLLHPHLTKFVEISSNKGARVRVTSNGTLLTEERASALAEAGLSCLIVSLDGVTADTYRAVRPEADLGRTSSNIRCAIQLWSERTAAPKLEIAMVVSKLNQEEASLMPALAKELGADRLTISPMKPPVARLEALVSSREEWIRVKRDTSLAAEKADIELHVRGEGLHSVSLQATGTHRCEKPWTSSVVLLGGEVMPCCNIHTAKYSMGNAFASDFAEVWSGVLYEEFRALLVSSGNVPSACRWCPDFR